LESVHIEFFVIKDWFHNRVLAQVRCLACAGGDARTTLNPRDWWAMQALAAEFSGCAGKIPPPFGEKPFAPAKIHECDHLLPTAAYWGASPYKSHTGFQNNRK
jgi:hypothetical protein